MGKMKYKPCNYDKNLCVLAHGNYEETSSSIRIARFLGANTIVLATEPQYEMQMIGLAGCNYEIINRDFYPSDGLVGIILQHKKNKSNK